MTDKHLLIVDKMPTDEEFMSDTWTSRLDYVGLVKNVGGGGNAKEVFYNFNPENATILKVKIEKPGNYGLAYIDGDISEDKPTIIDWGNGTKTTLTREIASAIRIKDLTGCYVYYSEPGEYEISIYGWYNSLGCSTNKYSELDVTELHEVLIEIIQVSNLIIEFIQTFMNCRQLTNIPFGLFDKNTDVVSFESTFEKCSNLTSIPEGLFDKNTKATNFAGTFYGCENLTGEAPYTLSSDGKKIKLWDRDGTNGFAKPTEEYMAFYGCTKLDDYEDIPDDWK